MISRIWHGWTKHEDAAAYQSLLEAEILPGIANRRIEGYRGAHLLRRDLETEVEFVTILWFESVEAVRDFAGQDYEAWSSRRRRAPCSPDSMTVPNTTRRCSRAANQARR